jgi:hypothetical protein
MPGPDRGPLPASLVAVGFQSLGECGRTTLKPRLHRNALLKSTLCCDRAVSKMDILLSLEGCRSMELQEP